MNNEKCKHCQAKIDLYTAACDKIKKIIDFINGYMRFHNQRKYQGTKKALNTILWLLGQPRYKEITIAEPSKSYILITNRKDDLEK